MGKNQTPESEVPPLRLTHIVKEDDGNYYLGTVSTSSGSFLSVEVKSFAICLIIVIIVSQSSGISHIEAIAQVLGKEKSQ